MIKELKQSNRVGNSQPLAFLSAPKRKRDDIDEICLSRQQHGDADAKDDDDDDFVYPLHKRSNSSTRLPAFCSASYDSERRDGPEDDGLDDETDALVKKYRTSIFRQEQSSSSSTRSPLFASSPFTRDYQQDDGEGQSFFELPSLERATTICDDSDLSTDNSTCYADPPEICSSSSRAVSPQEEEIIREQEVVDDEDDHWVSSDSLSLECHHDSTEEQQEQEETRARPVWLASISTSPTSAAGATTQPSPLWNITSSSTTSSSTSSSFWQSGWTGMFHQGSA